MRHIRNARTDATPTAECNSADAPFCQSNVCPRHRPANYAEYMARHSIDSIRPIR